jgi:hypothetical protein
LWAIIIILFIVVLALGIVSYLLSSLIIDYRFMKNELEYTTRYFEIREYNRYISTAPAEAQEILDKLDQAALAADSNSGEVPLPTGVNLTGNTTESDPNNPNSATTTSETNSEGTTPTLSPEDLAWETFHRKLTLPSQTPQLDVDEFKLNPNTGSYSYLLKQDGEPGVRLRGRSITVFAIALEDGTVSLVSDPKIDLQSPAQGYDRGSRYNIVASKVYQGRVEVPPNARILSVEVLAWEEDTKELVFLKKISTEGL